MEIVYLDKRIIVCVKPSGISSTDNTQGVPYLVRCELGDSQACVRTVHRLDQVVGGLMVLARSAKAASELSRQIRDHQFGKDYLAVVQGELSPRAGRMEDLLWYDKSRRRSFITNTPGKEARQAVLTYATLRNQEGLSLVQVHLLTGRTHQIRCQFASRGWPLVGDLKYGPEGDQSEIGLWSYKLSFMHPESREPLVFMHDPPDNYPFQPFFPRFSCE